jgi:DNA-binding transcriptional LysR family regulator
VEIKQLKRLLAVVEWGSLAAAAPTLGLTQQALGSSIANLEKELGVTLFDRGPGGVTTPTAYGAMMVQHAKSILASAARAEEELRAFRDARGGSVKLGVGESFAPDVVARAVQALHASRPDVKITLFEDYSEILLERLAAGEIDFIAGSDDGSLDQHLLRTSLYTSRDVIITRAAHPLAGRKNLTLADLQPFTWLVPYSRPSDAKAIAQAFERAGLAPPSRFIWTDAPIVGLQLLLLEDFVIMTSPAMVQAALGDRPGAIVKLDIDEPSVERRAGLTYRAASKLNPSAMLLMALISESATAYAGQKAFAADVAKNADISDAA